MKVTDIKEGEIIDLYYKFDDKIGFNRVVKISDDYTGLNRDIGYFAYVDRGPVITKKRFVHNMRNNIYVPHVAMAVWQMDLDYSEQLKNLYNEKN
jgi:hypothetical protein